MPRIRPVRRIDLDHVEARLQLAGILHEPEFSRAHDAALLAEGHELPRFAEVGVLAQLDLHKRDNAASAGDDVDLSRAAAKVALHNMVAVQAQIDRRAILAPGADLFLSVHPYSFFRKLMRWIGEGPYSLSMS